jgi:hypothetical protein
VLPARTGRALLPRSCWILVPSAKEYTRMVPVASRTTDRWLLVLVNRMTSTPAKSCTCGLPSGKVATVRIHSRSATMSPFSSKGQYCPAARTNGGVLVGSQPLPAGGAPAGVAATGAAPAGTAPAATSAAARSSVLTSLMSTSTNP